MDAQRIITGIYLFRHLLVASFVLLCCAGAEAWAAGDAVTGKRVYEQRCSGCHAVNSNKVGPLHQGIAGRKAGSAAGFAYSDALRNAPLVWNEKNLTQWLSDPESLIPGQRMNYRVIDPQEREHLAAYLMTL